MSSESRKRPPDLASVEGDDFPLRSGLVDSSSSSSSSLTKNGKRKAKKRLKMDMAKVFTKDNQSDPMGFRKLSAILDFDDEKFPEYLANGETSFLRQFNTKIQLGMDHLHCIGKALIRINDFPQPEKEKWWIAIDARIEDFIKMQLMPKILAQEMTEDVMQSLMCYPKINECIQRIHGCTVQPHLSVAAAVNVLDIVLPVDMDVDELKVNESSNDYRKMRIIPSSDCMFQTPIINPNKTNGRYENAEMYLKTQFLLLREDYVRPLRNDINEYRNFNRQAVEMRAASKSRINVYQKVRIIKSKMTQSGEVHFGRFDIEPFKNVRWQVKHCYLQYIFSYHFHVQIHFYTLQNNKRMMNGALVCLSSDNFDTFIFATVAGYRDAEKLARGEFQIQLQLEKSSMQEIKPSMDFVMIESPAYFGVTFDQ